MTSGCAKVEIDGNSGFCAGVINAIRTAESYLNKDGELYCLGDIVHNSEELQRLTRMGLKVITHEELRQLRGVRVLIRAHGEPPETYRVAQENGIEIVDATCKVVLNLQKTIRQQVCSQQGDEQILIYGKQGHAEVIGLLGQTEGKGLVISSIEDVSKIDFGLRSHLFSQTTQNVEEYARIIEAISSRYKEAGHPEWFSHSDTICRSVVSRARQIEEFARKYDVVVFVSGEKSSNGLYLFGICKEQNPRCHFISRLEQLDQLSINQNDTVGICGATSTPMWLMEQVKLKIEN